MNPDSVTVTTIVAVDPATAFKIFTTQTAEWWRPSQLAIPKFDKPLAWEPPNRLVYAPGDGTEVEVRFEPAPGGTRVTVEHRGWPSPPAGAFSSMIGLRWADALTALRQLR